MLTTPCPRCGSPLATLSSSVPDSRMCSTCSERLDSLLASWEDNPVPVEELCRDHPELKTELEDRIQALKSMAKWLTQGHTPSGDGAEDMSPPEIPGYEILGEIGRGGMGVVYKARQVALNRIVALKMVLTEGLINPETAQRFRLEAEAVAKMSHPHVVQIYEVGTHEGRPFFVMEYVDGGSLIQRIREQPLSAATAAQLVELIAQGVQHAHDRGIIHRDLKPHNILLTSQGVPRITDFGLAKKLDGDGELTQLGQLMGTPCYMSPEQAAGKVQEVGPSTDVYALGAVLYHCLVNRPPFQGPNVYEIVTLVLTTDPVPPRQLQPNVPADLETICLKCLHKSSAARYGSAGELADDLRRFLDGKAIRARPAGAAEKMVRWARRNPVATALIAASVLCVALLVAGLWYRDQAVAAAELAESNRKLAQTVEALAQTESYYKGLFQVRERMATRSDGWTWANRAELRELATHPKHDPVELRSLLVRAADAFDLRKAPELTDFDPQYVAFTSDSKRMAIAQRGHIVKCAVHVYDVATRTLLHKLSFPTASIAVRINAMRFREGKFSGGPIDYPNELVFSPDGRWLVAGTRRGQLVRWDLSVPSPEPVVQQVFLPNNAEEASKYKEQITTVFFSPDGKELYACSLRYPALKCWDVANDWREKTDQPYHSAHLANISPDGRWLAFQDTQHRLLDRRTGESHTMHGSPRWTRIIFTPCSQIILTLNPFDNAISRVDQETGREYMVQFDTANPGSIGHKLSIPSDQSILVTSGADTVRFWDMTANRLPRVLPLTSSLRHETATISPDGRYLGVTSQRKTILYEVNRSPFSRPMGFACEPLRAMALSPNGKWLATADHNSATIWDVETGRSVRRVKMLPMTTNKPIPLPEGLEQPDISWHPDNDQVAWGSAWLGATLLSRTKGLMGPLPTTGLQDKDDRERLVPRETLIVQQEQFRPEGADQLDVQSDARASNGRAVCLEAGKGGASLRIGDVPVQRLLDGDYLVGFILRIERNGPHSGGPAVEGGFEQDGARIPALTDIRFIPDEDYHFHILGRWSGQELRERASDRFFVPGPAGRSKRVWVDCCCLVPVNQRNRTKPFASLRFTPDGRQLLGTCWHQQMNWGLPSRTADKYWLHELPTVFTGAKNEIYTIDCDDSIEVLGHGAGTVLVIKRGTADRKAIGFGNEVPHSLALLGDSEHIAIGTDQGRLKVLRISDGKVVVDLQPHRRSITSVVYCKKLQLIVTGSLDRSLRFWRWKDNELEELFHVRGLTGAVASLRMDAEGQQLGILLKDNYAVRLWDMQRLREVLREANLDPWSS